MWQRIKSAIKNFFHRRRLIRYGIYLVLIFTIYLCRYPILRGIGNWLIEEDQIEKADAIVVLGGSSEERSIRAAELFNSNYAPLIITTGSNVSNTLKAVGLEYSEARITKTALKRHNIPDSLILVHDKGTSTLEEAISIRKLAKQKKFNKLILVSSAFHTARVHKYFNREFEGSGIRLIVVAAQPLDYKTNTWWKSEEGFLMVFSEYLKSIFYWWNY